MATLRFKEKFVEAATILKSMDGAKDVTTLLHRTPWVRILLEYDQQECDSLFIEVEISLPDSDETQEMDSSEIIDKLSEHLQYLQKLRDNGFELSIIGTGGICCASKELRETPEDNLFRALIPP